MLTSCSSFAKEDPEIPFIVEKTYFVDSKGKEIAQGVLAWGGSDIYQAKAPGVYTAVKKKSETKMVKASKITEIVKNIRTSLCNAVKKGEFKVWLKVDAEGKLFGVGVGTEGGIEVTVQCG